MRYIEGTGCACVANDAFKCWRVRNGIPAGETVAKSGGPCTCDCHETEDDECPECGRSDSHVHTF